VTKIILALVGILLAAAAAIMTVFYGGDVYGNSSVEAEAATLLSQSTQINAAFDLYTVEYGRRPGNADGSGAMDDLIASQYLSSYPDRVGRDSHDPEWKIDYSMGIARSTVGRADDKTAQRVCERARQSMGLQGEVKQCNDPTISNIDPCCLMSASNL